MEKLQSYFDAHNKESEYPIEIISTNEDESEFGKRLFLNMKINHAVNLIELEKLMDKIYFESDFMIIDTEIWADEELIMTGAKTEKLPDISSY